MTQEDKKLLLKDLLGRVLYGVEVNYHGNIFTLGYNLYLNNNGDVAFENYPMLYSLENIESVKPYLRPMSSMADEEFQELHSTCPHSTFNKTNVPGWIVGIDGSDYGRISRTNEISKLIDWLNEHHFDYRGLIEKGLALEAPEGMYKID